MSVATETMPDIEAWLQHEIEKPCEARYGSRRDWPCGNASEWVAHFRCDSCDCTPKTAFLCGRCAHAKRVVCRPHGAEIRATWIERTRRHT